MKILDKVSGGIDRLCKHIIVYLLIIVTAVLFIQVIARFVFNTGTFWTDELARFSTIWLVFLGAAILVRNKSLINVDVIESMVPKSKKVLLILQSVAILVYVLFILRVGWETLGLVSFQRSPNMGIPMSVVYAAIPAASIIMIIHLIVHFTSRNGRKGNSQ